MRQPHRISVLVVDDHFVVRMGLTASINSEPDMVVVGEAGSGVEAIEQCRSLRPDVVLMDLRLPRLDGAEAARAIRAESPEVQVIVLTVSEAEEDRTRSLRAGARAFLSKSAEREELLGAIRSACSGGSRMDAPPAPA